MTLRGFVLKFRIGDDEALKPLVTRREYSKPASKDDVKLHKVLPDNLGRIEIRKDGDTVMALALPTEGHEQTFSITYALNQLLSDLEDAKLFADNPF